MKHVFFGRCFEVNIKLSLTVPDEMILVTSAFLFNIEVFNRCEVL